MADVLLTGYPGLIARKLASHLLNQGDHVRLLTPYRYQQEADQFLRRHTTGTGEILVGDVTMMDLGLSGPEVRRLLREVEVIYHLASASERARRETIEAVNIKGTRTVLELALGADQLQRLNFLSTAFVSGSRQGVVMEEELDRGQKTRNEYERTKLAAERLVRRASRDLPVSIFRPSLVVGDSQTGEFEHRDDPYRIMLAFLSSPLNMGLPLPGRGDYPLNLVPADYVVQVISQIARDPRGIGLTFHVTDPNPLPARRVLELLADHAQRRRPRGHIPAPVARRLFRLPIAKRFSPPESIVDYFNHLVIYNTINTFELLSGTDIMCPPFHTYVGKLVAHLQRVTFDMQEEPYGA